MMRSMYSAVSGLRVHQSKMDTIGNNIANVNTVGFKKGQVSFQEVFSQVVRGASAPQGGKGGTNPQQIGMGVSTGSINTIHTPGNGQRTDNPTDLMISGEGFFVVSDDANFNNKYYTRAGNFSLDRDGNLVTADGLKVLGYGVDEEGNIDTSKVTNIRINQSETKAPTATDKIIFEGNLDAGTKEDDSHKADTIITDSLGNSYKVTYKFVKGEVTGTGTGESKVHPWTMTVDRVTDMNTGHYRESNDLLGIDLELVFDSNGKLVEIGEGSASEADIKLVIPDNFEFTTDKNGDAVSTTPSGTFPTEGITLFDPTDPDTTKYLTQYANETDLEPFAKTGNTSGTLDGFTIDAAGVVTGVFSNGERKALGQLMVAKFDNPMGLQKMGGNMFLDTRNSGEAQLGSAGSRGVGAIEAGVLEMSNVDISLEFTEMITTQRGFQANSRIITTSDEMLQELVNMKR